MMMTKQKPTLTERLNIGGDEVRELKLGATFNPKNTSTAFHTIKYDFKPASVDTSRMATVDVGSNNQVTVTVPNLESSGVPQTVYKGNHKKYTKECLIIFDKETGAITLERLNHNIQVKKTRSEVTNKPSLMSATNAPMSSANGAPVSSSAAAGTGSAGKLENSTMRISSKTKVSTGSRRNNIIDFKPRNSPMQQSSPSRPVASHRSPQSAPAWHANNAQQTLPSIPMIMDDDDFGLSAALHNGNQANISGSSTGSSAGQPDYASAHTGKQRQATPQGHAKRQQLIQRSSPPMQQHQQQYQNYGRGSNNYAQQQQQQQQQLQQRASFSHSNHSNSMPMDMDSPTHNEQTAQSMAQAAAALEQQIGGELSASSSSSESDSSDSDSGSDSDDSTEDDRPNHHPNQQLPPAQQTQHHHMQHQQQQHMHQLPNLELGSVSPAYNSHHHHQQQQQSLQQSHHHQHQQQQQQQQHQQSGIYASNGGFPNDLLQNDLQLSSNSSDDDDD
ncbi:ell-associated factor Eaf [Drosophila novamexicana]|uniref:ell-associated factor Eaf n=1 Tax=Drosophila novamexicana TaxID=47314 RepID=UPI0011E5D754|nr:ell-associated factor Eaf [Drosophila novamexicana]XP_030563447.1 ell-associated factor Eaf [Drosophila novamexicana]